MSAAEGSPQHTRFARLDATADAVTAALIREEFSRWLRKHFTLDAAKISDVVLAVNEALANAAEFAYPAADQPGAMHMHAEYDPAAAVLAVTVTDEGSWLPADSQRRDLARGRGIPLMHALADRAVIDGSPDGTRVRLEWTGIDVVNTSPVHGGGSRTT
ncbi:ATP-binding protein [uncultured Mycobacterium sp.]|uniref:ATP-binding protein n=1 Tax=uncultured Mycobacterium sp. TaxID=171292 RepID=UPI0035C998DE